MILFPAILQDIAHITLPSAATRNLAAQVEAMQYNRDPESAEALTRLRTWLRYSTGVTANRAAQRTHSWSHLTLSVVASLCLSC